MQQKSEPHILITREQADTAMVEFGPLPFHYAAKRFKEEHGIVLTAAQVSDGRNFKFELSQDESVCRITYLGERK